MSDVVYLTKERVNEFESELHDLKTRGRREMAQKISDARSHGDLSENADYDAAKEAQQLMEMKIAKIEMTLAKVQIIKADEFPSDKVYILSKVKIKNTKTGDIIDYQMVSPEEADFERRKLSVTSPIGKALLGKVTGDFAQIKVPAGIVDFEILEISK
ncbi:MAG: transcription elongation factor GreA [Candidatus Kapabacteria bacterium]|nr:transcription elongation factor GreA [Candidatus Kapabacteria bacterium]